MMSWVMLVCVTLQQSSSVDITGRFENQLLLFGFRAGSFVLDENRLRVGLRVKPRGGLELNAAVQVSTYHGATELPIEFMVPSWVLDSIPDSVRTLVATPIKNQVTLDRAFVSARWPFGGVRVGKQPLAWGVGYVWNPTEVIGPRTVMDPTYEREGQNALRVDFGLFGSSLQLFALPGKDLNRTGCVGRLEGNTRGFDWAVTCTRRHRTSLLSGEEWAEVLAGGQTKGEFLGLGVWAEGSYHWPGKGDGFLQLCAGADYTLTSRTYLVAEYFHDTAGLPGSTQYMVADWLRLVAGEVRGLGRDYLFVCLTQPVLGFHSLGIGTVMNLSDGSALILPQLQLDLAENLGLRVVGSVCLGSGRSEYGASGASGLMARLSVYF